MTIRDATYQLYLRCCNVVMQMPGHRLRRAFASAVLRWDLGRDVSLERGIRITCKGGVRIGARSIVNSGAVLDGRGGLTIGNDVNISSEVAVLSADHDPQSEDFTGRDRPVTIGDRCWLATRAVVLPGTVIEDGCVVAAGGVARGVLRRDGIYGGNPVRRISDRSPQAQTRLSPYRRFLH